MLRRGQPVAHVLYGAAQTVNGCTYGLIKAFSQLELLSEAKCRSVFIGGDYHLRPGMPTDHSSQKK